MTNGKLRQAKKAKNDEFYTEYSTISNEMAHHREQFRGQIVYCNCDDPTRSNFWKYFHENFDSLGLKKLISTYYRKDAESSYAKIYEGGDDFDVQAGENIEIRGNKAVVNGREVLYSAGDFRSDACLRFMEEADIISTNPPFSLFREHVSCLIEHNKKFLILGNQNASTTKEIFPLFKENIIWYGESIHSGGVDFRMPDDYEEYSDNVFIRDGHHYINLSGVRWFTNMDVKYRHDGLWHKNGKFDQSQAHCYYEGNENYYPKYDNYDAIEVGRTKDVPVDYADLMGVPVTWLDKYNPDEFEIIDGIGRYSILNNEETKSAGKYLSMIGGKAKYFRIIVRNLHPKKYPKYDNYDAIEVGRTKDIPIDYEGIMGVPVTFLDKFNPDEFEIIGASEQCGKGFSDGLWHASSGVAHPVVNGKKVYSRLFIRNRHPIKKADDLGY